MVGQRVQDYYNKRIYWQHVLPFASVAQGFLCRIFGRRAHRDGTQTHRRLEARA